MGCSTSTLDDDPHPKNSEPSANASAGGNKTGKGKDDDPIITFDNTESQGNKFISNDDL